MEDATAEVTQVCKNKTCGYIMNSKHLKRVSVTIQNSKPRASVLVEQWKCPRCFLTQPKLNEEA